MSTEPSKTNSLVSFPQPIRKKNRRRHTRVQLEALRPIPVSFHNSDCPKCQGYVRTEAGESLSQIVIRCLNCGWQPHLQAPNIQETEESRMFRLLSSQFVSASYWDQIPVNF